MSRKVISLCVCAGAGLALLLFTVFAPREPAAPEAIEVLQSELELRDGRWHQLGAEEPFTGTIVAHYSEGTLQSRSEIVDGLLHGISEGWHTNGTLQVREHFQEGVSHGLRTKWHENGQKLSEGTIVNGQFHGVFRRWHENGTLAERVEMREGQPDGIAESFYPSAFLKARATLSNGQLISQEHWEDGQRRTAVQPEG